MGINITVIGGGSSYTPELFANLTELYPDLDVDQIRLVDLNEEKLALVGRVSQKLLDEAGSEIELIATTNLEEALPDSNYVLMQIRVGGLEARIRDETVPMEFGMVGNETTGPGGFVCGLRTVRVALDLARKVEELAPGAWILNLSNPAGMVTEAILNHTAVPAMGFCNIPINTTYAIGRALGVDPTRIRLDSFGLNHLSWTRAAFIDDEELLAPILEEVDSRDSLLYRKGLVEQMIAPEWIDTLQMIPGWYLRYFYYPDRILEQERREGNPKGESDQEAEKRLHEIYVDEGYTEEAQQILSGKGGAQYYLPVLQVIDSMVNDREDVVVVDVLNQGAIQGLPADACVEIPAHIRHDRIEPCSVGPLPLTVRGLVQAVNNYEALTIEAVVSGDRQTAVAALMAHPLVPSYPVASAFFERVLENERAYLPQFFESESD